MHLNRSLFFASDQNLHSFCFVESDLYLLSLLRTGDWIVSSPEEIFSLGSVHMFLKF
ncbi:hypothetical protein MPTK1_2g15150 [Marchantia polymorpha subsp. ruderalis]|uniref:Uncharacterized protein n=1 Tax=Marchantia polymorpha TaxID=3197 RepID=A0A2R6WJW2_MARPO|nr:hypothetical protein MARPO_0082s0011 [Marchantia polymorpha]BBN02412.1 hypothetical protein Mp_2g15150 [Marchantia polymorpha subsp. ruderalis]|eukprot:PTQ34155.1 hypothetical protein MARPO_0082s0011 [Marchantia polymorpha]